MEKSTLTLSNKLKIQKIRIQDTWEAPNWAEILEEYDTEAGVKGLPKTSPNKDLYTKLEAAGLLQTFGAFLGDILIGYITVTMTPSTHYEKAIMFNTESFFVLHRYRKTGAGLKLLDCAEKLAKDFGAYGLMVSARSESSFSTILGHLSYTETNKVFFKKFD